MAKQGQIKQFNSLQEAKISAMFADKGLGMQIFRIIHIV